MPYLCEMQVWKRHDHDTFMTWEEVLLFADEYFVLSSMRYLQYAHAEITEGTYFFEENGKLYVTKNLFSNSQAMHITDSVGNIYFGNFAMRQKVIFYERGRYVSYRWDKVVYRDPDGLNNNRLIQVEFYPELLDKYFVASNIHGKVVSVHDIIFQEER